MSDRRGRPRSLNDEVVATLLRFGVKPGVVALCFGVHPKTVERAKKRYDDETVPAIERLRADFRAAMAHVFSCAEASADCETCMTHWRKAHE